MRQLHLKQFLHTFVEALDERRMSAEQLCELVRAGHPSFRMGDLMHCIIHEKPFAFDGPLLNLDDPR